MLVSDRAISKLQNGCFASIKCFMIRTVATVRYLKCRHCPILIKAPKRSVNQKVAHSRMNQALCSFLYHPERYGTGTWLKVLLDLGAEGSSALCDVNIQNDSVSQKEDRVQSRWWGQAEERREGVWIRLSNSHHFHKDVPGVIIKQCQPP